MTKPDEQTTPTVLDSLAQPPAVTVSGGTQPPAQVGDQVTPAVDVASITRERDEAQQQLNEAKQKLADLEAQAAEKEKQMTEQQQAQENEALKTLEAERDAARAEAAALKLERELTGKVVDTSAAVRLMGSDYRKEDGTVDVDGFLEKHPYLRPGVAATAPNGGGGTQTGTGKEAEIQKVQEQLAAAEKRGNRMLAVSLQSKLTALRQS